MNKDSKILVVGHQDIIEQSLRSLLTSLGHSDISFFSDAGIDPVIQTSVYDFFANCQPEYVFLTSTRSGGIEANRKRGAEFLYHNSQSQNNIIYSSWKFGVKKLMYLAGSCVYPKDCAQPMKEESLLTGALEETSEPYSVAKIAGIKLCQAFRRQYGFNAIAAVLATVYGPGADTGGEAAHVMGALIGKFADAVRSNSSKVTVWGTGKPRREFLYANDFAEACLFLMNHYEGDQLINIGSGSDVSIGALARMIADVTGFKGDITFDETRPDGAPQKLLESRRINKLGWKAQVLLEEGIKKTYEWYRNK